jgi:hypothetical protein
MNEAESTEYRGHTINVYYDDCGQNPIKEWDGNFEFCCWHSRYDLGNSERFGDRLGSPEECQEYAEQTNSLLLPLYLYDHSGVALSLGREYPFNCPWDSGQVGFILIDRQWLKDNYGKSYFTKKIKQRLYEDAKSNVETYNYYLSGNVYGYKIETPNGDDGNNCWGFYGYDHRESGLLEYAENAIDCAIERDKKAHFQQLKRWIRSKTPLQYRTPFMT